MIGVYVVLGAVLAAFAFGGYRRLTDGRVRPSRSARDALPRLDAGRLGAELGSGVTFVQFSSTTCAPCRSTHRLLSAVAAADPAVAHVDVDAEHRLDLVEAFGILRTPTVLLLDGDGVVRRTIVGAPRKPELLDAVRDVTTRTAA